MLLTVVESEVALYAMRRRDQQPLAAVGEGVLEMPQVLSDVAFRDGRLLGDLLCGQLARAE